MNTTEPAPADRSGKTDGWLNRALNFIEVVGNKLPDPAVLFFLLMVAAWIGSAILSQFTFDAIHPSTGEPIQVINQLSGDQMVNFLVNMVSVFVNFAPLGIVLWRCSASASPNTPVSSTRPCGSCSAGLRPVC